MGENGDTERGRHGVKEKLSLYLHLKCDPWKAKP